jgi:hypothetical protein
MACTDSKSKTAIHDVVVPAHIWPNEPHWTIFRNGNIDFRVVDIFRITKVSWLNIYPVPTTVLDYIGIVQNPVYTRFG